MTPGTRSAQAPYIAAVGLSARMLAQSARRAGLNVAALDIFGDRDTRRYAPLWFDIGGEGLSIDAQRLFDALERTARLPRMLGFVMGSGLEPLMQDLCSALRLPRLIGNSAGASAAVREPRRFLRCWIGWASRIRRSATRLHWIPPAGFSNAPTAAAGHI